MELPTPVIILKTEHTYVLVTNVKIYGVYVLQRYTNLEDAFVQNNLNVSPITLGVILRFQCRAQ